VSEPLSLLGEEEIIIKVATEAAGGTDNIAASVDLGAVFIEPKKPLGELTMTFGETAKVKAVVATNGWVSVARCPDVIGVTVSDPPRLGAAEGRWENSNSFR
jgi:hypothetical protein